MSRFANLEWEKPKPPGPRDRVRRDEPEPPAAADELRDEAFYLKKADEQYGAGHFEKALRYYSRALEFDPNLCAGWVGQVRMLIELGELEEARVWADKALDLHRDHPDLLSAKAQACARLGEPDRALAFSDLAMKGRGASAHAWLARGEAILASRRGDAAHCFEKAAVEGKGQWFVPALVARIYLYYAAAPRALAWAERSVGRGAGQPLAWLVLGHVQAALGLDGDAERAYRHALSLEPDSESAGIALERLAMRSKLDRVLARIRAWFGGLRRNRRP
jgi:predicted Zn-dependent protease